MKFYNWINEIQTFLKKPKYKVREEFEEAWNEIEKNVKKDFLQSYKNTGKFILRAVQNYPQDKIYFEKKRRSSRKPKDTKKAVHTILNKLFKEKFGWPSRNGVFTKSGGVDKYGKSFIFFPIGNYKFVWSPYIDDLFTEIPTMPFIIQSGKKVDKEKWAQKKRKTLNTLVNKYKDDNLESAIKSGNEISFKISKYYLLENDPYIRELLEEKLKTM